MSSIAVKGADTGTGVFTIESPATNTDRTLTLPDVGGGEFIVSDASGNVGIGTSSPSAKLSLAGPNSSTAALTWQNELRKQGSLYSDTSGVAIYDTSLNSAGIYLSENSKIDFRVNGSEAMRIDSSGNLLVGTTNAATNAGVGIKALSNGTLATVTDNNPLIVRRATNSGNLVIFGVGVSNYGSITTSGSATSYNTSSDYRLKEDWQPVANAITDVKALKPCNFAWKVDGTRVNGFLAHELAEVVPEAVTGEKDAVDDEGNPAYQGIDQSKLVPLLTAALQEAIGRIETLEAEVATLKGGA